MAANDKRGTRSKIVDRLLAIRRSRTAIKLKRKTIWKHVDEALRHPVSLLVLGFVLTGGIGSYIQDQQHQLDLERTEAANAYLAITHMREAVSEFIARARLFESDKTASDKLFEAAQESQIKAALAIQDNSYAVLAAFPNDRNVPDAALRDNIGSISKYILAIDLRALREPQEEEAKNQQFDALHRFVNGSLDTGMQLAMDDINTCTSKFFFLLETSMGAGGERRANRLYAMDLANGVMEKYMSPKGQVHDPRLPSCPSTEVIVH